MAWRVTFLTKILVGAISLCLFIAIYLSTSTPSTSPSRAKSEENLRNAYLNSLNYESQLTQQRYPSSSDHHLAVIVPFRERFEELLTFAPHLHRFLTEKSISHDIIVVNQADTFRFNRAALINIGFSYATNMSNNICDYVAMHDVDLLPLNKDLPYEYPKEGTVMHVAGPGLHPKYNYPSFIGGILLVTVPDFRKVNGMSNIYWGWGMEDDELFVRLKFNQIEVKRPTGIKTGKKDTFHHIHSPKIRPRDMTKCFDQYNKTKRRDRLTGLKNLNYTLISVTNLSIEMTPVIVLNVKLQCDTKISPWCDCGSSNFTQSSGVKKSKSNSSSNKSNQNSSRNNKKDSKKSKL